MQQGIRQWGNLGGLIAGLFQNDYDLISRSLEDHIVEPIRSILIPAFDDIKANSLKAGALGSGISGSGPSIFALSKGEAIAQQVAASMKETYQNIGIDFDIHISKVNSQGVKKIT
jgi:homoserine kinase